MIDGLIDMAIMESTCKACNNPVKVFIDQHIWQEKLYWSSNYNCRNCGCVIESDNLGKLPDTLKKVVIEQEGLWGLCVSSNKKIDTLKVIKKNLLFQ